MRYEEITTHTIKYNYEDIILWVKTFAGRQLGINPDQISEEAISITPDNLKNIEISVTHSKTNSNIKQNEETSNL